MTVAKVFRIIFCILAVACAASAILVGVLVDWSWCLLLVAGTIGFAGAMLFCRKVDNPEDDTPNVDFEMDFKTEPKDGDDGNK